MSDTLQRILYAEDEDSIAAVTVMTLEDLGGFEVRRCASGREALDMLAAFAPQLVLLDVMMPEMDGPETLQRLRTTEEGRGLPVIFITARAQTHEQEAYRAMGALGVIVKPYDPIALCGQVRSLWERRHDG